MAPTKRITSRELARLAGVSSATISRAFSPGSNINAETRQRIHAIAKQYEYQPNALARSLNGQKSGLVGVVVRTLANPCEAEEQSYLVESLQAHGLMPIFLCFEEHSDSLQLMRLASSYQLEHVLIFSDTVPIDDAVDIFRNSNPIIVTCEPPARHQVPHVQIDGRDGAAAIIDKLANDGRRHFAYIAGRQSSWLDRQRRSWFADALASRDLRFEAVAAGDYSYDSGFKEAVMLLQRNELDVLVCGNDVMAIGAVDAARQVLGRQVPEQLAVVGQDGISIAGWESHKLTTLAHDHREFIDAVMQLVVGDQPNAGGALEMVVTCVPRWGTTA